MADAFAFFPFIAALMALGIAALVLPGECKCTQCGPHMHERKQRIEAKRATDHRKRHGYFNYPWGEGKGCNECDQGNARDQRR